MTEKNISLPLFYLPPISWWVRYYEVTVFNKGKVSLVYPSSFVKHRYFHRCVVKGPMGKFFLTIPIEHDTKRLGYHVRTADNENWRAYHFKVFQNYYSKAPFFEEFFSVLKGEILKSNFLYEINKGLIVAICQMLDLPFPDAIQEVHYQELMSPWEFSLGIQLKPYPQFYGEFLSDLSIADLLMQEGMESRNYFRRVLLEQLQFNLKN